MKQKLTTANLGQPQQRRREGRGKEGWEQMRWASWEGMRGQQERKAAPGSTHGTEVQENWGGGGAMEGAKKNILGMMNKKPQLKA